MGVFLPHSQCYWDKLQIFCDLDEDKTPNEMKLIKE